jgi:hypothetical protein
MATNKEIFDRIQDLLHTALIGYLNMVTEGERLEKFLKLSYVKKNDKNLYIKIAEKQKLKGVYDDGKEFGVPFPDGLIVLKDSWDNIVEKKIYERRYDESSKNYIYETIGIRNKYDGHSLEGDISLEEVFRIFDTFYRFATVITASPELLAEIYAARKDFGEKLFPAPTKEIQSGDEETKLNLNKLGKTKEEGVGAKKKIQGKGYSVEVEILGEVPDREKVLSVPAEFTYKLIQNFKIYSCPNEDPHYDFNPTKYIAFRDKNGEMHSIYQIEKIIIVHDLGKMLKSSTGGSMCVYELVSKVLDKKKEVLPEELKRLKKYCNHDDFKAFFAFYNNSNRYYLLSDDVQYLSVPKQFTERKIPSVSRRGSTKERLIHTYINLSDFEF